MNMQRTFMKTSVKYYIKTGSTYSEALKHASADAKWWRDEFKKALDKPLI